MGEIFENHMTQNLFRKMSNDELQKCYRSYQKSMIARERTGEWGKHH